MNLSTRYSESERHSRAVINQMELRAKPSSASVQNVFGRFIRVVGETFLEAPAAARRMADLALARTYHLPGYTWSGAMLKSAQITAGRITVHFMSTFGGLLMKGSDTPDDFEIAGSSGRFQPAQAQVHGRTVIVSSPAVRDPEMVRFPWSDIAVPNLFNKRGWPALAFPWSAEPKP
jgi:hypothetical protein